MKIPVYAFLGFLESGKTTFVSEVMGQNFTDGQKGLLIACEEGEEEYDPGLLKRCRTDLVFVHSEEYFTAEYIHSLLVQYHPERVLLEYNGMWNVSTMVRVLEEAKLELYQTIMTVDSGTFDMYWANTGLTSRAVEMFKISELVLFVKGRKEYNMNAFRRRVKAVNPRAQIGYDMCDGSEPDSEEMLPYDINADVIRVEDEDYGIFHMDMMENPKRYDGKTVYFRAVVAKPDKMKNGFVPGRFAMTCCAEDIQFIGYIAKLPKIPTFMPVENRQWIYITATVRYEFSREYRGKGPVYYPVSIEKAEKPEQDVVYF